VAEKAIVVTNVWSGSGLAAAILLARRGFNVFGTIDEYVSTTEKLAFTQIQPKRGDTVAAKDAIATLLGVVATRNGERCSQGIKSQRVEIFSITGEFMGLRTLYII